MTNKISIKKFVAGVLALLMVVTALPVNGLSAATVKAADDTAKVYRSYNPNNGEHLYTIDKSEHDYVVGLGYKDEGERFVVPASSKTPIYRAYDPNSGEHLLVPKDEAEWLETQGWKNEGIKLYADDDKTAGVYRVYNPNEKSAGRHNYSNKEEADWLVAQGWKYDNNGEPVFYSLELIEQVEEMTAEQTGAKEITITLPSAGDGTETYTVKKGKVAQTVASTKYDGKKVILTMDNNIKAADYTVISSDKTLSEAEFTGEEAALETILIGEELIPTSTTTAVIGVKTLDQWGGDITVTSWDSCVTSAPATPTWDSKGVITLTYTSGDLIKGGLYTVSVVKGTKVATQTVEFVDASVVNEISVGELTPVAAEAKINTTGRIDADDINGTGRYYFPVYAEDQYGNQLDATTLSTMVDTAKTLVISPLDVTTGIINAESQSSAAFTALDDGTVAMFIKGDGNGSYGDGIINIVSTSGAKTTAEAYIDQNERIETLSVSPADTLIIGSPIELNVEAENNYGEAVDLYKEVTYTTSSGKIGFSYTGGDAHSTADTKTEIAFSGSTPTVAAPKDTAKKTVKFTVQAVTNPTIMTVTTAGGTSVIPSTLTARDTIYPQTIKGFTSDVKLTLPKATADASDVTGIVTATDEYIEYYDQYGNEVPDAKKPVLVDSTSTGLTAGEYKVTLTKKAGGAGATALVGNGNTGIKRNTNIAGEDTYTISLYKVQAGGTLGDAIDTYDFKVTVVDTSDIKTYEAVLKSDDKLLYVGGLSTTTGDKDQIVLYGTDSLGTKTALTIDGTHVKTLFRVGSAETFSTGDSGIIKLEPTGELTCTGAATTATTIGQIKGSAIADVYVNGVIVTSVEVPYSNATPQATAFVCKDSSGNLYDLSSGFTTSSATTGVYCFTTGTGAEGKTKLEISLTGSAHATDAIVAEYTIASIDQYGLSSFTGALGGVALTAKSGSAGAKVTLGSTGEKKSLVLTSGTLVQVVPIEVP